MDKIKKTGVLFMSVLCVLIIVVGSNLVGCAPEVADNQEKILLMDFDSIKIEILQKIDEVLK